MITCDETGLNECPFCGHLPRWCGSGSDEPHECHQIVCDGCNIRLDIERKEAQKAESMTELRNVAKEAWNQRYSNKPDMSYQ